MYPLFSTKKTMLKTMRRNNSLMSQSLGSKIFKQVNKIHLDALRGKDSYHRYSNDGVFHKLREKYHKKILDDQFKDRSSVDRGDPDIYIFGGVAASGKSSTFRKKVPESAVVIDPDIYKKELAKKNRSPIKGRPLAHASYLHEESSHIKNEAVDRSLKEKRNVILDITMANREKQMKVVERYKRAGYDVHFMGTQLRPTDAMNRASGRFLHGSEGRYVPMMAIYDSGNTINRNVLLVAKSKDVDSARVVDTTKKPGIVVYRKGSLKRNYRNP